jgi:hypothetical protein
VLSRAAREGRANMSRAAVYVTALTAVATPLAAACQRTTQRNALFMLVDQVMGVSGHLTVGISLWFPWVARSLVEIAPGLKLVAAENRPVDESAAACIR